jgi:hypothetical protein
MPTELEMEKVVAIKSIANSLDILVSEIKRLNDKLDTWTMHDSLATYDVSKV